MQDIRSVSGGARGEDACNPLKASGIAADLVVNPFCPSRPSHSPPLDKCLTRDLTRSFSARQCFLSHSIDLRAVMDNEPAATVLAVAGAVSDINKETRVCTRPVVLPKSCFAK